MTNRITENAIEEFAIDLLEKQGYQYIYAPDIAPDSETPERESFEEVLLIERLRNAVGKINPTIPADIREDAIKQILRLNSPELIANNETFHRMLTEGIKVSYQKDGDNRGDLVWLIDFKNPENNEFIVSNQFTVIENNVNKRPDIILFVNGLPLVVFELKNPTDENATVKSAFKQFGTYKEAIPGLFNYNGFLIISDGLEAKSGTISAGLSRFMAWKTSDGKSEASKLIGQMETLINGMLNKETLLDLIRHFIVFEKSKKEDVKTGIVSITTVKILAAYHQYYAVNRAVESTLRATGYSGKGARPCVSTRKRPCVSTSSVFSVDMVMEDPASYGLSGVKSQPRGDRKGGVVWHTQGSGKSLSMVFFTGKIVLALDNPTILVITDRNDLDDQLFDTFAASTQLLRQEPKQVENREDLKEKLKVASGGVIFSTIQKFQPDTSTSSVTGSTGSTPAVYETLSERENIVVIADEAHRTQYGFKARLDKETGAIKYGFAKYMRDALPNATYIGFTGTPIESTDVNTPAVFGNYIDVYDIAQAVEDGATVRIYYESRLAKVNLSEEGRKIIEELDDKFENVETHGHASQQRASQRWTQLEALIGSGNRIKNIASDIVTHFEARQEVINGKGMIVSMSRRIAADLFDEIIKIRPEWYSDDLDKGVIKVVMTSASSDGPKMARHHTTKQQRKVLADRMKDPEDEL